MGRNGRLSVAVLGAGLIGADLAVKVMRSGVLDLQLVVGRDESTAGLRRLAALGMPVSGAGVTSLAETGEPVDVAFDATNALAHAENAERLAPLGTMLIDLTPSRVGHMVVPTVNGHEIAGHRDINMVSCGGQASIPVLHAITRAHQVDYVEVVTTAATLSVGRGTRLNLDEYIETTQDAVRHFTGVKEVKSILNISPATPPARFRVAMSLLGRNFDHRSVRAAVDAAAGQLRSFLGGFTVTACDVVGEKAFVAVEVTSSGDRIPEYAGNLDIINSAALYVAEQYAASRPETAEAS